MKRVGVLCAFLGLAIAMGCSSSDGASPGGGGGDAGGGDGSDPSTSSSGGSSSGSSGGTDGGFDFDTGASSSSSGSSGNTDGGGPVASTTVLTTTDEVRDVAVLNDMLYVLLGSPSRIETCPAAGCTTRTVRVDPTHMPPEQSVSAQNPFEYWSNDRLMVAPLGTGQGLLVAQQGNRRCAIDCFNNPPPNPGVYNVFSNATPDLVYVLSWPEATKSKNQSTIRGTRGTTLLYENQHNNEAPGGHSMVAIRFGANATNTELENKTTRDDTRADAPFNQTYDAVSLVGAHDDGSLYVTRSGQPTELFAADLASLSDNSNDTSVNVQNATFLATTGTLRFVKMAATPADQLVRGTKGDAQTNTTISLAGLTANHTILGSDLGLLWYVAAGDAGASGPISASFCSDAALAALPAGGSCAGTTVSLDLDTITAIKDGGSYVYVLGKKGGQATVVRFAP